MKLDRNINGNGRGKYALVKLRVLDKLSPTHRALAIQSMVQLDALGMLDEGIVGTQSEFMLIRLKDTYARAALSAYAAAARVDDPEYASDIDEMVARSGPASPFCQKPD